MKTQVTRKQIADNFYCIAVGYCDLQAMLYFKCPRYYTAGLYGWNFDVYEFEHNGISVAITTGYRGMINNCKNHFTYTLARKYETKARAVLSSDIKDKRKALDRLVVKFLTEVFQGLA